MKKVVCIVDIDKIKGILNLGFKNPICGEVCTVLREVVAWYDSDWGARMKTKGYIILEYPLPGTFCYDAEWFRDLPDMDVDALIQSIVKPELQPA